MKICRLWLLPFFLLSCSPKKAEQRSGPPAIKTVPETLFLCVAQEGTLAEIPAFAEKSIGPLYEALGRLGLQPAGDLEFICPQWRGPDAPNKAIFAIPVAKEFSAPAPSYLWKAPAYRCAWIEYTGPMSGIQEAWMKLEGAVRQNGLKATAARREVYVHWVSPDSLENRTELQIGIE